MYENAVMVNYFNFFYRISPFFIYIAIRNYVRVFSKQERREKTHKAGSGLKREAAANPDPNEPQSAKKKKKKKKKKDKGLF